MAIAGDVAAVGALSSGGHVPIEQRVALSIGPARTTLWTQLRVDAPAGPFAVVVPALPGASLDWTSDAWFEALEMATAPRVLPPSGVEAVCPGETPPADPVYVAGDPFHVNTLSPIEVVVHADADAVVTWALSHGLTVTPELYDALLTFSGQRFVAARFTAATGEALTPALRVSGPSLSPVLPLVLSQAASAPLRVTSWSIAEGATVLDGPRADDIEGTQLVFDAADGTASYDALRSAALESAGAGAWLLEATGRVPLSDDVSLASGSHTIEGVVRTYFTRAALYDGLSFDVPSCIAQVDGAIAGTIVAASCPRADLGVVDGVDSCSEVVLAGEVDPALLRCGNDADDLAVAMSQHDASATWITRHTLDIPSADSGAMRSVSPSAEGPLTPVHTAGTLDLDNCAEGGSGAGGGGEGGTGAGPSVTTVEVPVYEVHSGCGADEVGAIVLYVVVDAINAPDAYYVEEADDCGGDTSESYTPVWQDETETDGVEDDVASDATSDDCSGDSAESTTQESGDDCGGDTSESTSQESGDDCGGDTSESYETSETSSETSETSDSSDDSCGGDTSDGESDSSCSLAAPRREGRAKVVVRRSKAPRASIVLMGLAALALGLRRRGR